MSDIPHKVRVHNWLIVVHNCINLKMSILHNDKMNMKFYSKILWFVSFNQTYAE